MKADRNRDLGLLTLRVGVGLLFLVHGFGKLMNLVNGQTDFPDPLGIGAVPSLGLAVFSEFVCSLVLIAGWKTRWVAIPPLITMLVAAFIFHSKDPLDVKELALLYAIAFLAIVFLGGGGLSVDGWLARKK